MESLCWLDAADLSAQFAAKTLEPVAVAAAVAQRIEACEPKLNAIYLRKHESAAEAAAVSAHRLQLNLPRSPLDGVPITVKENLYSIGDPAPIGTPANPVTPKTVNSPVVDRLREAGLVIVGKTTMPDFGMLSSGRSSFHGTTHNPWQLDRNPGGSSSGAAAACAAGYGPLHIGTDIGGSVRLPAHFCGIFGLKPSLGRVPINPPYLGRVAGPMTRTVRDAAMLMDVISQPDSAHRDFMNLPPHAISFARDLEKFSVRGKRIGIFVDAGCGIPVHPDIANAVVDCAKQLEAQGAQLEPMPPIISPGLFDSMCAFFEARSGADISAMTDQQRASILPFIVRWATYRSTQFSGRRVMRFYNDVVAMRERTVAATHEFDFVLSPTCPIPAYEAAFCCPGDNPERALHHIAFTVPYNMSEQPAASINWSYVSEAADVGLPIGVQVAGRRFDDLGVLQISRLIEQLRPTQRPWPVEL